MPTIAEAMSIAASHHQAGRLQEAELIYGQIVAADPNNSEAWHRLGGIAGQCGDRERAIACFDRALERKSNSAELHSDLGTALQMQGKYTQAVRCFRRAIAIRPEF